MSKRITQVYDGFLSYEKRKNKNSSSVSPATSAGLLSRRGNKQFSNKKSNYSELDKVLSYVESIRKYRTS